MYVNYEKNNVLILLISSQKLYFGDDDTIDEFKNLFENDVITTDLKSAAIHLLNQFSFRHTQPFSSFIDKSTGPILLFLSSLCLKYSIFNIYSIPCLLIQALC